MKTSVTIGEPVWCGHTAFVAGVSASIRILIAKAQLSPPGDSDE